jgi:hypothetical protein
MPKLPTKVAEIQEYIDSRIQENIHLDYKASPAIDPSKGDEIAKDVSAFANSDGGLIIYGVEEDKDHFPLRIDSGIDHSKFSHERLEHIIQSKVTPIIDDVRIQPIPLSRARSVYVVQIPKSYRTPHQSKDKKYYKRYNFESVAMEDYEINDIRARQQVVLPLINVEVIVRDGINTMLVVTNIGTLPAKNVRIKFSKPLMFLNDPKLPALFGRGSKYFPPGRTYHYYYQPFGKLFSGDSKYPADFDVKVSYVHPQNNKGLTDIFHIDLKDYENSTVVHSELVQQTQTIKECFKKLTEEVQKVSGHVQWLTNLAGATGLDLSMPTLKNLMHLATNDGQIERVEPHGQSRQYFQEVLGVDYVTSVHLHTFFRSTEHTRKLKDLEGMTDELMERIGKYFTISDEL